MRQEQPKQDPPITQQSMAALCKKTSVFWRSIDLITVKLIYSRSLLGHFTVIIDAPKDGRTHRVHMVDRDALTSRGSFRSRLFHKITQVSGYARAQVLHDSVTSTAERTAYQEYDEQPGRELVGIWKVTREEFERGLAHIESLRAAQASDKPSYYGYIRYSDSVENCGSFAINLLEQMNIPAALTLNYAQSWLPFPSLIKDSIRQEFGLLLAPRSTEARYTRLTAATPKPSTSCSAGGAGGSASVPDITVDDTRSKSATEKSPDTTPTPGFGTF